VRAVAQRDAQHIMDEAKARHDQLSAANAELRDRLASAESVLRSLDPGIIDPGAAREPGVVRRGDQEPDGS